MQGGLRPPAFGLTNQLLNLFKITTDAHGIAYLTNRTPLSLKGKPHSHHGPAVMGRRDGGFSLCQVGARRGSWLPNVAQELLDFDRLSCCYVANFTSKRRAEPGRGLGKVAPALLVCRWIYAHRLGWAA